MTMKDILLLILLAIAGVFLAIIVFPILWVNDKYKKFRNWLKRMNCVFLHRRKHYDKITTTSIGSVFSTRCTKCDSRV